MRLEPCGDAATSSDRMYHLLWKSEMYCGMVLLGFRRPLSSGSSRVDRTLKAKMARLDSLLDTIFSFARSSRILIYVRTNFHSFDILSIRFVVRECICDDFLFTDMSTNVRFRSGSPVSWMLVPLPWRVSYRLALLLWFPKSHAVPDSPRDQVIP